MPDFPVKSASKDRDRTFGCTSLFVFDVISSAWHIFTKPTLIATRLSVHNNFAISSKERLSSLSTSLHLILRHIITLKMPTAFASSTSSKDDNSEPRISTMTSGDGASAAASSKNKDGWSIFQMSKSTGDEHGTHTKKTTETRDTDGKKDSKIMSKDSTAKKDKDTDDEQGVFAKAGGAFAAAGGAVASAAGGRAVASTE
jgi:hypothetical protein